MQNATLANACPEYRTLYRNLCFGYFLRGGGLTISILPKAGNSSIPSGKKVCFSLTLFYK